MGWFCSLGYCGAPDQVSGKSVRPDWSYGWWWRLASQQLAHDRLSLLASVDAPHPSHCLSRSVLCLRLSLSACLSACMCVGDRCVWGGKGLGASHTEYAAEPFGLRRTEQAGAKGPAVVCIQVRRVVRAPRERVQAWPQLEVRWEPKICHVNAHQVLHLLLAGVRDHDVESLGVSRSRRPTRFSVALATTMTLPTCLHAVLT